MVVETVRLVCQQWHTAPSRQASQAEACRDRDGAVCGLRIADADPQ